MFIPKSKDAGQVCTGSFLFDLFYLFHQNSQLLAFPWLALWMLGILFDARGKKRIPAGEICVHHMCVCVCARQLCVIAEKIIAYLRNSIIRILVIFVIDCLQFLDVKQIVFADDLQVLSLVFERKL